MAEKEIKVIENLNSVSKKIREAEIKCGREPGSVKLLAVSKFHPAESVLEAVKGGQLLFGENRVQEASGKFPSIIETNPDVKLHIIGQLQTNKVKKAVEICDTIQSVDRLELIKEIEKQAAKLDKKINILFEVHTGEESKSGFNNINDLLEAVEYAASDVTPHVIPKGFMTMAPFTDDKNLVRNSFRELKRIASVVQEKYPELELSEFSMGMSGDYEIAIEEGSTMVRVGTAIFGERQY